MAKIENALRKWANQPMRPGEGLHVDIFRAAIIMLEHGHTDEEVYNVLRAAANQVKDRHVPDREIFGAIRSAKDKMAGGTLNTQRWPTYNPVLRAEIVAKKAPTADLAKRAKGEIQNPWFYLECLYLETDYVCLGATSFDFTTALRERWFPYFQAGRNYQYINPSPMIREMGLTKDKVASAHCLDNTGPKIFQVVEFDFGAAGEHVALHMYLANKAPLFLLVYSGSKSVHGWYNVRKFSDEQQSAFFASAVEIGADPKMFSRAQFSRLPAGFNIKTGKRQTVLAYESYNQ